MIAFPKFSLTFNSLHGARDEVSREFDQVRVALASALSIDDLVTEGFRDVANCAALATLNTAGMDTARTLMVFVKTLRAFFVLARSSATAAPYVRIPASGRPGWIWQRVLESRLWWTQITWYVDPVSGDDEGQGDASTRGLKTVREFYRRTAQRAQASGDGTTLTLNLLGDLPDADTLFLSEAMSNAINVVGTMTVAASGTISAAVARNPGANASNDITIAGFNWAPYVGVALVRLQATPTTTAAIEANLGANTCRLGEQIVGGTPGSGFTAGQVVEIVIPSRLPGITISAAGGQVVVSNCTLGPVTGNFLLRYPAMTGIFSAQRCVVLGSTAGTMTAAQMSLFGCAISRDMVFQGILNTTCCSFISANCSISGGWQRNHLQSTGGQGSTLQLLDGSTTRFTSDFHMFGLAAGVTAIQQRPGTVIYFAAHFYGSGNNALSAGIQQIIDAHAFLAGGAPTMDAGLGLYTDSDDGPLTGGTSIPWVTGPPILPFNAQLNAMVPY